MKRPIRSCLFVLATGIVLAGCGSGSSSSPPPLRTAGHNRNNTCKVNQWVGNRKSHAVHKPGSTNLPSPKNQVCFNSLADAQSHGYHQSR